MKYQIIYADPPWSYSFSGTRKNKEDDYPTMSTEDICNLPIGEMADDNCILFIWIIFNRLHDALKVIDAWGFEYKTCAFVWIKKNKDSSSYFWGMGEYTRQNIHQVIISRIREHSRKPDEVRENIVKLMGDIPRIELFARQRFEGWDVWGNEAPNLIQKRLEVES